MDNLRGKIFASSYSGGKDSVLAIYRAIGVGLLPGRLITTRKTGVSRSWFHGAGENMLQKAALSMNIPLDLIITSGAQYTENFEYALKSAKDSGAQVCVFGDIDIEGHLRWCTERCEKTGLIPYFPLLKEERKKLVYEFIDAGFSAVITTVDHTRLSKEFIGQLLTRKTADLIEESGADICGENGEYHTFVFDGPIFKSKVDYLASGTTDGEKYITLNIT